MDTLLLEIIVLIWCILGVAEIYTYYKNEKQRIRRKYDLYRVCFSVDGELYIQIIGGKSKDDVRQLVYSTYDSADVVFIFSIHLLHQSKDKEIYR